MRKSIGITVGLIVALTGAVWAGLFSDTLRYKVTVAIETPEGLKIGSAVREAGRYKEMSIFPGQGGTFYNITKGEAVVVDLGERGVLFALLGGQREGGMVFKLFPNGKEKEKITLISGQHPVFVRFQDLGNPKTIENVRPSEEKDKFKKSYPRRPVVTFEESFGAGVSVKEVIIEVTDEPVTWGIEKYLPWVSTIGEGTLSGKQFNIGQEWYDQLSKWEFKKELK